MHLTVWVYYNYLQWFWEVVEKFDRKEQILLLQFTTGR